MYESISCGGPLCSLLDFEVTNFPIDHSVETHSLSLPVPVHPRWLATSLICMNLFLFAVLAIFLSSSVIRKGYATFAEDDYCYYMLSVSSGACLQSVSEH